MSLTLRKQQADSASLAARERARQAAQQAAQQLGPLAKNARDTAASRLHDARVWAAPRIEQAAQSVQENVAPKVSAALEATAQRLEPAPAELTAELKKLGRKARRQALAASQQVGARKDKLLVQAQQKAEKKAYKKAQKRRWPKVMGSIVIIAASAGAVAAVVMRRNRDQMEADLQTAAMAEESGEPRPASADDADAGFDGQVRTP